ncbi:MAG: hypothetical protein HRU20_24205 [Pseudomonadales bacterium]|nr:hypothetical protein [Pseudomonadales bacterium]
MGQFYTHKNKSEKMMNNALSIIDGFKNHGWESNPLENIFTLKNNSPEQLLNFVQLSLKEFPAGASFIDVTLSYLCKEDFEQLLTETRIILTDNSNHLAANSVMHIASLQYPEMVDAYSTKIITERQIHAPACSQQDCEIKNGTSRQLFFDDVKHIVFDEDYLLGVDNQLQSSLNGKDCYKNSHPSWQLEKQHSRKTDFGGNLNNTCGCCGDQLQRLIHLPADTINNHYPITLATCTACLGWEEDAFFYRHDKQGLPEAIDFLDNPSPAFFSATPFKKTAVHLTDTPARWCNQNWHMAKGRENLNRIGGRPTWIQDAVYPQCPCCQNTMKFCAQFDFAMADENEDSIEGICYAFWCEDCAVSGVLRQYN